MIEDFDSIFFFGEWASYIKSETMHNHINIMLENISKVIF